MVHQRPFFHWRQKSMKALFPHFSGIIRKFNKILDGFHLGWASGSITGTDTVMVSLLDDLRDTPDVSGVSTLILFFDQSIVDGQLKSNGLAWTTLDRLPFHPSLPSEATIIAVPPSVSKPQDLNCAPCSPHMVSRLLPLPACVQFQVLLCLMVNMDPTAGKCCQCEVEALLSTDSNWLSLHSWKLR